MAMRDLVDRECGGANPLMKLTSHFTQDRSRRQDGLRHAAVPPRGAEAIPRTFEQAPEGELVNEFLAERHKDLAPATFHMNSLLREMQEIENARMAHAPQTAPAVMDLASAGNWAEEYLAAEAQVRDKGSNWSKEFMEARRQPVGPAALHGPPPTAVPWAQDFLAQNEHKVWTEEYERELLDDKKWVDEFKPDGDKDELAKTAQELLSTVDDPKLTNSEFMKFIKRIGQGELTIENNELVEKGQGSGSKATVQPATATVQPEKSLSDRWAEEFTSQSKGAEASTEADFWDRLQEQWEEMAKNDLDGAHPWLSEFDDFKVENQFKEYKFEEENPLRNHPDPFSEGMTRLQQGDIPNAVLLFEAAVQKNDKHIEAWQYLGTTQADNEQEPSAIAALNKCLELDPGNLTALLSLAVSLTNESLPQQACQTLKKWISSNPRYAPLMPSEERGGSTRPQVSSIMSRLVLPGRLADIYIIQVDCYALPCPSALARGPADTFYNYI